MITYQQFGVTKEDMILGNKAVHRLMPYILAFKKIELGDVMCERCGSKVKLEIHHNKYGADVNYYDLELLCYKCHRSIYHTK